MLLRHGLIVLAIATAVTGAGIAIRAADEPQPVPAVPVSTALPVSRRSDPSIDRFTRTKRPITPVVKLTGAQRWISSRSSPFVAHDSDPTVSLNLLGWGTAANVAVYINAAGPNAYNRSAVRDASRWLVRSGKEQVHVDGWLMLDIRQPAARHWWLYGSDDTVSCNPDISRRAALDLIACGYKGLWVDNVLTQPSQWFKPDPHIDAAQWGDAEVALLQELRAALPPGVPFTINEHWTDVDFPYSATPALDPTSAFVRAAQIANQVIIEGGAIDPGLNYDGSVTVPWSYPRLLAYADAMHAQGARMQWEKTDSSALTANAVSKLGALPSCHDPYDGSQPAWKTGSAPWRAHVRTSAFNLATALLTYAPGDSVGDMCEYPGRGFRAYGQDLGQPLGPRTQAGPVHVRQFSEGLVAVNPSMTTQTVTLPPGQQAINLASGASKADNRVLPGFTLGPRSAVIAKVVPVSPEPVASTP